MRLKKVERQRFRSTRMRSQHKRAWMRQLGKDMAVVNLTVDVTLNKAEWKRNTRVVDTADPKACDERLWFYMLQVTF